MRKTGIILTSSTVVWLAGCAALVVTWFFAAFSFDAGASVEQIRHQGLWGVWLAAVSLGGAVVFGLASLALSRRKAAIAFGVVAVLLLLPVGGLARYSYKELKYQPCATEGPLWDCPTDLD